MKDIFCFGQKSCPSIVTSTGDQVEGNVSRIIFKQQAHARDMADDKVNGIKIGMGGHTGMMQRCTSETITHIQGHLRFLYEKGNHIT
mmetsp:Transcript_50350/g.57003  ORF Transcript_50350/g.57003 Transcript_50350/m.57003 type:complete len:87 (-) Transcript_50350:159-419(-)